MKNESELSHSFRSTLDLAVRIEVRFRSMNTVEDIVVDCLLVYDENHGSLSRLFPLPHRMMRSEMTSAPLVAWTGSTHQRSSSQIEDRSRCSSSRIQMNQPLDWLIQLRRYDDSSLL